MNTYVIEREIPGASSSPTRSCAASPARPTTPSSRSNKPYTWLHSYVAGDKIYCFHQAESADVIREHARRGGFPPTSSPRSPRCSTAPARGTSPLTSTGSPGRWPGEPASTRLAREPRRADRTRVERAPRSRPRWREATRRPRLARAARRRGGRRQDALRRGGARRPRTRRFLRGSAGSRRRPPTGRSSPRCASSCARCPDGLPQLRPAAPAPRAAAARARRGAPTESDRATLFEAIRCGLAAVGRRAPGGDPARRPPVVRRRHARAARRAAPARCASCRCSWSAPTAPTRSRARTRCGGCATTCAATGCCAS